MKMELKRIKNKLDGFGDGDSDGDSALQFTHAENADLPSSRENRFMTHR